VNALDTLDGYLAGDDQTDFLDPDDLDCTWCGGEGFSTCDDPLGCPGPHIGGPALAGGECACRPCNGTGRRSEQWLF
jgi:hypothetical protein